MTQEEIWEHFAKKAINKILGDKNLLEINGNSCSFYDVIKMLNDNQLTLTRRGEWVKEMDRTNHWHCSNCGFVEGVVCRFHRFCPRCGAFMRDCDILLDIDTD